MPCLAGFLYIIILPIPMAINNPPNHLLLVPGRGEVLGFDEEIVDTLFLRCEAT